MKFLIDLLAMVLVMGLAGLFIFVCVVAVLAVT